MAKGSRKTPRAPAPAPHALTQEHKLALVPSHSVVGGRRFARRDRDGRVRRRTDPRRRHVRVRRRGAPRVVAGLPRARAALGRSRHGHAAHRSAAHRGRALDHRRVRRVAAAGVQRQARRATRDHRCGHSPRRDRRDVRRRRVAAAADGGADRLRRNGARRRFPFAHRSIARRTQRLDGRRRARLASRRGLRRRLHHGSSVVQGAEKGVASNPPVRRARAR